MIIARTTVGDQAEVTPVLNRSDLLACQALLRKIVVSEDVNRYAARLARASRPGPNAPDFVNRYVRWGAGPRASQFLSIGARVRAGLSGRTNADFQDIQSVAKSVLRHRIVRNFQAEAEGIQGDAIVEHILQVVQQP